MRNLNTQSIKFQFLMRNLNTQSIKFLCLMRNLKVLFLMRNLNTQSIKFQFLMRNLNTQSIKVLFLMRNLNPIASVFKSDKKVGEDREVEDGQGIDQSPMGRWGKLFWTSYEMSVVGQSGHAGDLFLVTDQRGKYLMWDCTKLGVLWLGVHGEHGTT